MKEKAGGTQFRGAPEEDRKKAPQLECLLLMEQGTGIEQLLLYDLPIAFLHIVRICVQNNSWNIDETREENAPVSEKAMTVLFPA